MKAISVVALVLCVVSASALTNLEYQSQFTRFVSQFEKQYPSNQFFERYAVFKANLDYINAENAKNLTYKLAVNQFADLTTEEFTQQVVGGCMKAGFVASTVQAPKTGNVADVDWRAQGAVTGVKNQASCGSCWAFSAVGALEGAYFLAKGELLSFSEQQLVDCSGSYGNHGCNGGLMTNSFKYWIAKGGACLESDYTYTARDGTCKTACTPVAKVASYYEVRSGDENALGAALQKGPVSIAVQANQPAFQHYSSGIVESGCGSQLNHGITLTTYTSDSSTGYWTAKNSWGASWGNKGYISLRAFKNVCGIAGMNSQAVVA